MLRQDPDVILIGELRDPESIQTALSAAETGHLVLSTLHTQGAAKSINRIVDVFPADQQQQIRTQLGDTLQGVISQTLMPLAQTNGRTIATEVLINTPAVANMIREGQVAQLYSAMQAGSAVGMHTLDQDLRRLVEEGTIAPQRRKVTSPSTREDLDGVHVRPTRPRRRGVVAHAGEWHQADARRPAPNADATVGTGLGMGSRFGSPRRSGIGRTERWLSCRSSCTARSTRAAEASSRARSRRPDRVGGDRQAQGAGAHSARGDAQVEDGPQPRDQAARAARSTCPRSRWRCSPARWRASSTPGFR